MLENISDSDLPVNKMCYLKLVSLCVSYGCFTFNDEEYVQHRGLAMGSPLSAVMASLYMESLERDRFLRIIGRGASWFRYVDDVLVIVPEKTNMNNKLRMLNEVNDYIQFTVEEEVDKKLPFLDVLIHRTESEARFSVYRKQTNKDDYIHYMSNHDPRTKSGVVIGFFLRAYRVCSEEFLENECLHIVEAFERLGYPVGMIQKLRRKAETISRRDSAAVREEKGKEYVIVPYSKRAEPITRFLTRIGMNVVHTSGRKIGDTVKSTSSKENKNESSIVYEIPCGGCGKKYYGESSRGLDKRVKEHKSDLRHDRQSNSLVVHARSHGHLPSWNDATILPSGLQKKERKTIEAAYIATKAATNHREGFVKLSLAAARIIVATSARRERSSQSTLTIPRRPAR